MKRTLNRRRVFILTSLVALSPKPLDAKKKRRKKRKKQQSPPSGNVACPVEQVACGGVCCGAGPELFVCNAGACEFSRCASGYSACQPVGHWEADLCKPLRPNGLGQFFESCDNPPGTYNQDSATKAASSWDRWTVIGAGSPPECTYDEVGDVMARCAAGQDDQEYACWAFRGPATGHVALSFNGMRCPTQNDPVWG